MKNRLNQMVSVDTIKSIAIAYINQVVKPETEYDNCEEVFGKIRTWAISKTGVCQNIFRLTKQKTSSITALSIRTPSINDKGTKKSKTIQLTNWQDKDSGICWKNRGALVLGTKMYVPPSLREYFLEKL